MINTNFFYLSLFLPFSFLVYAQQKVNAPYLVKVEAFMQELTGLTQDFSEINHKIEEAFKRIVQKLLSPRDKISEETFSDYVFPGDFLGSNFPQILTQLNHILLKYQEMSLFHPYGLIKHQIF
jgi:hypothetical protein